MGEGEEAFLKHDIHLYKSLNRTGVNKSFCCCKNGLQRAARKRLANRTGLFLHVQHGTSWSPVVSTAGVTELHRRVLKMHLKRQVLRDDPFLLSYSEILREHSWGSGDGTFAPVPGGYCWFTQGPV